MLYYRGAQGYPREDREAGKGYHENYCSRENWLIMISFQQITDYLSAHISDPVPKYIYTKEILKSSPASNEYIEAYNGMKQSKWYRELAEEQHEDGSWGGRSFGDKKKKFINTGAALRRVTEMSLSKDDPMVANCVNLLEMYVNGEKEQTDRVEVHEDGGKGNIIWRKFGPAMDLNRLDPDNPLVKPLQKSIVEIYETAFETGYFDEEFFYEAENDYRVYVLAHPRNSCSLTMMSRADCFYESLQRKFLLYVWGKASAIKMKPKINYTRKEKRYQNYMPSNRITYMSNFLPISKKILEENDFTVWLSLLEQLSGFSLFGEFMKEDALPHLLNEAERLIVGDVFLPNPSSGHVKDCGHDTNGRYAESWRDNNKHKTDMVLRIARILAKC